jgi:hypothetical protein
MVANNPAHRHQTKMAHACRAQHRPPPEVYSALDSSAGMDANARAKRLLGQDVPRPGPHPEPSPSFSLRFARSLATARSLPGSPSLPARACGASRWHTWSTAQPAPPGPTLCLIACPNTQPARIAVPTGPGLRCAKIITRTGRASTGSTPRAVPELQHGIMLPDPSEPAWFVTNHSSSCKPSAGL